MSKKEVNSTRYNDVPAIARRLANGDVSRKSLREQASRFRKNGRPDLADNIAEALAQHDNQYAHFESQRLRLAERGAPMSEEEKMHLRVTLDFHSQKDLLTDALVAWQSFFEARGMELSTSDLFTMWAIEKAQEFEELTGEPIARQ